MKPRNKFEKLIVCANSKVGAYNPKAKDWAMTQLVKHPVFISKKEFVCGCCGESFKREGNKNFSVCPICGKKIDLSIENKRTYKDSAYFSTLEIVDRFQVLRTFRFDVQYKKRHVSNIEVKEVCRHWLDGKGNTAVTRRQKTAGYYLDSFNWSSDIELRGICETTNVISDTFIYPRFRLIPEIKRNGLTNFNIEVHPFKLMQKLLTDSRVETLLKSRNKKALKYFIENPRQLNLCWESYKITQRQHYEIGDFQLWGDLISLLEKCNRDIHSPKYICPSNLIMEHDYWLNKLRDIELKRQREQKLEKARKEEKTFFDSKSCFFGIIIKDDEIEISVLDSVKAYFEEGEAMKHCVFSNSYYTKPDSVILSAHYKTGHRIETVEFSLTHNKVIQSRGVCNQNTEHHDRIINLVNENAHLFIKAKKQTA